MKKASENYVNLNLIIFELLHTFFFSFMNKKSQDDTFIIK